MFEGINTVWVKGHRIFIIAFLVAVVHLILTSVIGYYIAVQVETQVGHVVAEGFIQAYEESPQNLPKSEGEAKRNSQDMKNKSERIIENWKYPLFLISLPVKPLLNPYLKHIRDTRIEMVLSKEMSKDQFYKWGTIIDYTANFINSFCVGFLVYVILRISRRYKMKT